MESIIKDNMSEDGDEDLYVNHCISIIKIFREKIAEDFNEHFEENKNLFVTKWSAILGITVSSFVNAMAELSPHKEYTRNTILTHYNKSLSDHLSQPYDGFLDDIY